MYQTPTHQNPLVSDVQPGDIIVHFPGFFGSCQQIKYVRNSRGNPSTTLYVKIFKDFRRMSVRIARRRIFNLMRSSIILLEIICNHTVV